MATDVNPEMSPEAVTKCCASRIAHLQAENDRLRQELAQLQQSESYYRQIFENAPISMLSLDLAGYLTRMNPAAEALYGLAIEPFNQQACPIFNNPQLVENGTLPYILRAFAGETVIEEPTFYDASRDMAGGNLNYGRGHYFPLRDSEGKVDGIVEIAADFKDFFELQAQMLVERDRASEERVSQLAKMNILLRKGLTYFTETTDLNGFLGYILQEAAQQTGACAGHIFVYDVNKDTFEMCRGLQGDTVYSQALTDDPKSFRSPFPARQIGPLAELCEQRSLMLQTLDTTAAIPDDIRTWHQQQQHHQLGMIALMAGTQPLGLIGLAFKQSTTFKPETLELLNILTDQASLVIHLTQLAEERRQSAIIQERNYTAREIHDTLAQDFGGILIQLQAVDRFATTNPTKSQTHRDCARDLARKGLAEARSSIWVLSQEGEAYSNLAPVLEQLAAQMTLGSDTQAQVTISGSPLPLPPEQGMHLLRIVQESCNNALRHAQATQIQIQICYGDGSIELRIIDDGVGFEAQRSVPGFGLKSMQQRAESIAAILQISSELNQGTEVRVMMPIETESR
jgi:PAS domain S-box-containing protein